MGDWLTEQLIGRILSWFADTVTGWLDDLWAIVVATLLQSPDVTGLPQVTAFAGTALAVVDIVYVLAFVYAGLLVMARENFGGRYGVGELLPRLVVGFVGANFALPLCSALIRTANALTEALAGQPITDSGWTGQLHDSTVGALRNAAPGSPSGVLLVVIGLLIAFLVATLLVQSILRVGLLIVVVGLSPIALALHGTAHTEPAAKLWWRTLVGALAVVLVQAVGLHLALAIFLSPQANLPAVGFPGDPSPLFNLFVVACLLIGLVKVPALMRRYVTGGRPGAGGQLVRLLVVQQLTRGVQQLLRGGGRGRAARLARRGGSAGAAVRPARMAHFAATDTTGRSQGIARYPDAGGQFPTLQRTAASSTLRPGAVGRRTVRPYTAQELREGVDLYTRRLRTSAPRAIKPAEAAPAGPVRLPGHISPATVMPRRKPARTVPGIDAAGTGWPRSQPRPPASTRASSPTGWPSVPVRATHRPPRPTT